MARYWPAQNTLYNGELQRRINATYMYRIIIFAQAANLVTYLHMYMYQFQHSYGGGGGGGGGGGAYFFIQLRIFDFISSNAT